jgi:hypothetical protein
MTTATTTKRAERAAAKAAAEAARILAAMPTQEQLDREAAEAAAEEAANLKREQDEIAAEEMARMGYQGPMLRLRERLKAGKYIKAANGQPCCGDQIATAFGALTPAQTIASCIIALDLAHNPYLHLNVGQQSMNLRNKLRQSLKKGLFGFGVVREAIEEVTGATASDVKEIDEETDEDSGEE